MNAVQFEQPLKYSKMKNSSKISVKNLPSDITQEEVAAIVNSYGNVETFEIDTSGKETCLEVTYESNSVAIKALEGLNNYPYKNHTLQAELSSQGRGGGGKISSQRIFSHSSKLPPFLQRIPLRILVSTQYVGAIIGKKGATVKHITTLCKARIDVHSKNTSGGAEKVISIYGQADNRSQACKEVLLVLCNEGAFSNKSDVVLKLLAGDEYSGRLIGKEGRNIRKIREDSNAKINIVVTHELSSFYPDRVVMIRGGVDEVVAAEAFVSKKLAVCYEADAAKSQTMLTSNSYLLAKTYNKTMPSFYPQTMKRATNPSNSAYPPVNNYAYGDGFPAVTMPTQTTVTEVVRVGVPDSAVGALIGSGGAVIKHMMRTSGAFLSIERKDAKVHASEERIVCVKGGVEACCRALYNIYERMRQEGFSGPGESRLKVVVGVPLNSVGRLIGKGGSNIRSLQKVTGAIVRVVTPTPPVPSLSTASHVKKDVDDLCSGDLRAGVGGVEDKRQEGDGVSNGANNGEIVDAVKNDATKDANVGVNKQTLAQADVQLFGNFSSVLNAHMRIRSMTQQATFDNKLNKNPYNNNIYPLNNINNNIKPRNKKVF